MPRCRINPILSSIVGYRAFAPKITNLVLEAGGVWQSRREFPRLWGWEAALMASHGSRHLVPSYVEIIDLLGADVSGHYGGSVYRNTQPLVRILIDNRTEASQTCHHIECSVR